MDHHFRKLLYDSNETSCSQICYSDEFCVESACIDYCSFICPEKLLPPAAIPVSSPHHSVPLKFLITGIGLASIFVLVCCYAFYAKFYSGSRRRRRRTGEIEEPRNEINQEFLDEDHGPVLDHPIWYIHTVGLQPSIINSISVCKYKRSDRLIEGTDCSVCLNEFEEDETVRLLPKCSHAFHIPCIDTWLRSHTNCPNCRAPIVTNSSSGAAASSSVSNIDQSSRIGEETRVGVLENSRESGREIEGGNSELGARTEQEEATEEEEVMNDDNRRNRVEDELQPIRRSVSLDSLSAFKISQDLAIIDQLQSNQNSRTEQVKRSESNLGTVSKRFSGNQSLTKLMGSSSIARSLQIGPSSLKRSISCGGKLFLARYGRNSSSSVLPL